MRTAEMGDGLGRRLSRSSRSGRGSTLGLRRPTKRVLFGTKFQGLCRKNMGINGAARNAGKNSRTCTSITRRRRKEKRVGKTVSTTGSFVSSKLSTERTPIRIPSSKLHLFHTHSTFILHPTSMILTKMRLIIVILINCRDRAKVSASPIPPTLTPLRQTTMKRMCPWRRERR